MKLIPIGRIESFHGVRGEITFKYYNEVKEDFSSYTSFFTETETGYTELFPVSIKESKGRFIIHFEGFQNREQASVLLRRELFVREEDLPPPPEGTFYDYQVVGLDVLDNEGNNIGQVTEVYHSRGADILIVNGKGEFFIPMIEEYIDRIDLEKKMVTIKKPVQAV